MAAPTLWNALPVNIHNIPGHLLKTIKNARRWVFLRALHKSKLAPRPWSNHKKQEERVPPNWAELRLLSFSKVLGQIKGSGDVHCNRSIRFWLVERVESDGASFHQCPSSEPCLPLLRWAESVDTTAVYFSGQEPAPCCQTLNSIRSLKTKATPKFLPMLSE